MRYVVSFLLFLAFSCTKPVEDKEVKKPKLAVGLIVDQMRFEILERLDTIFGEGGFKRLKREGFEFRNCAYNHAHTLTAPGHATIATGAPPSVNGIAANSWYSKEQKTKIYAVHDPDHFVVGNEGIDSSGTYSPRNLLAPTIGDAFKLAYGDSSQVVGISGKNRAAILSAGKEADLAFWIDNWAYWVSSNYFTSELPDWVIDWNDKGALRKYQDKVWEPLLDSYPGTSDKELGFERTFIGQAYPGWPKDFSVTVPKNGYRNLLVSPYLNKEILDLSKLAISELGLGKDDIPDYLAISISGTDKIGHAYGPHSEETADAYLRLDKEIESFLNFLDRELGPDSYVLFLTADHGIPNIPGRIDSVNNGGGRIPMKKYKDSANLVLLDHFNDSNLIMNYYDEQIWMDTEKINLLNLEKDKVFEKLKYFYLSKAGVKEIVEPENLRGGEFDLLVQNGFVKGRSGDLFVVYEPGFVEDWKTGVDHGTPHYYDRHVPLIWFGSLIPPGVSNNLVTIPSVATTLCDIMGIDGPSKATEASIKEAIYSE